MFKKYGSYAINPIILYTGFTEAPSSQIDHVTQLFSAFLQFSFF